MSKDEKEPVCYVLTEDEIFEWFWKGYEYALSEKQKKKDVRVDFYNEFWKEKK